MSYVEKNLIKDEEIIYRAHLHWTVFGWTITWGIIAITCGFMGNSLLAGLGLSSILVVVLGLNALIKYKTSEFAITNKRIIVKVGFIRRTSVEVLLNKIEGIQVDQSIIGRMLDYGSISIRGTGGSKSPFRMV